MMVEEVLGIEAKKLLLGCLILIEDSVAAKGAFPFELLSEEASGCTKYKWRTQWWWHYHSVISGVVRALLALYWDLQKAGNIPKGLAS
jgi:hypothetical protein